MAGVALIALLCYSGSLMEQKPTPAAPVNWEAVRMLALTVGVRESARRCGLSEEAVKKRCTREGWLVDPIARESARASVQLRSQLNRPAPASGLVPILSPSAALSAELAALSGESRVSIARTVAKAGKHFETMDAPSVIADAQNLKSIAQTADLVHGWKDQAPQVKIRLDVLNGSAEPAPIDIEAREIDVVMDSPPDDYDLDSY